MSFFKRQRPSTVLGLSFDGVRVEGAVVHRTNGSLELRKTFEAPLSLGPLTSEPEQVGRELQQKLQQAGLRERRCVVALPLSSALTTVVEIPDLPPADVASFLDVEAERAFPYGPEALIVSTAPFSSGTKRHATLVAYQRNELLALERALRAAQLKPLSFSLGIAALQEARKESSNGVLALLVRENSVDLQISANGGLVALRALKDTFEADAAAPTLPLEVVAREIRITLGQLPELFRNSVRRVRIFGIGMAARQFVDQLTPRAKALGMTVEVVERYAENEFARKLPQHVEVSPAFSLAARYVANEPALFEFLPPRVSRWQQATTRLSARKLGWIGGAAAATAVLIGGAFLFQQWQLSRLGTRWTRLAPEVKDLEQIQQQIRKYRPWYDESFASLSILRKLTEAFPAEGVVTAKTLEIRGLSSVTCSGTATDNQALLKVLDQLRGAEQVSNLKVDQVRGKTPMQFTFNFQWGAGGGE